MNVAALATLVSIIDTGSFASAADDVGCTPSAVSLQVKQLEQYFGQSLFDRSARTARPTAFCAEAANVAREFLGKLESLRSKPSLSVSGRVRLGAIATIQTDALPLALRWLRTRYPELDVRVSLDDSTALLAALKASRVDAAALIRPRSGGSTRLLWHDLARQPFVILKPASVKAASAKELLERFDVIRYDTSLTGGQIAARYVRKMNPHARCVLEARSIDAIVAMVSAGLGVSVVPRPRRQLLDAHAVREVPLGARGPVRQIALVRRSADADNRNIDAILRAFVGVYAARSDHATA